MIDWARDKIIGLLRYILHTMTTKTTVLDMSKNNECVKRKDKTTALMIIRSRRPNIPHQKRLAILGMKIQVMGVDN